MQFTSLRHGRRHSYHARPDSQRLPPLPAGQLARLIVVPNEQLLEVMGEDVTQDQAFAHANDVLKNAVGGISAIIHIPGLVNVDFEDVKTVMSEPGKAMMGTAVAGGPDRATKAAELAVACPLLEGIGDEDICAVLPEKKRKKLADPATWPRDAP